MLTEYYEKVKQETTAISQTEQKEFLAEAEKYFADLKEQRYTILIAGKTCFRCLVPEQPRTNLALVW